MNNKIDIIDSILREKLEEKDFVAVDGKQEEYDNILFYKNDAIAYSVKYQKNKQVFVLRSGVLDEDDDVSEWKNMTSWLFDQETGTKAELESIAKDFLDLILGPDGSFSLAQIKQKKKKKSKDDERNVDPTFLFNRLVNFLPDLKEEMNKDKIIYGKVRFATLTKSYVAPNLEQCIIAKSIDLDKLTQLFNDMYNDGDKDVRSIIIHGLYNSMNDQAMDSIKDNFSDDMKKVYKCSRPLKNKDIKPEKPKKKNKFMAKALESQANNKL